MDKKQAPWSRREMIERRERQDEFDVTVSGAGATGLGVARDAASRGMSAWVTVRSPSSSSRCTSIRLWTMSPSE